MVLLHLLFGRQTPFFHLDLENNLPTFYQSGKLLLFGFFLFSLALTKKLSAEIKFFMIPLTLVITFLGLDELFQIHENIYRLFEFLPFLHPSKIVETSFKLGYRSSLWMLYYLPILLLFVFWGGYWLRYFQSRLKSNFWIILISLVSFFTVLLAEIIGTTGKHEENTYFWLVTIEEMAEMILASTLVFMGLKVFQAKKNP